VAAAVEATAAFTAQFSTQLTGNIIKNVSVTAQSEFTHSTQADRIRNITADILISFQSANVITGFLQDAQVNITDAFTPAITAVALKNHTAVLDVVCSLSCVINKTVGMNSTLNTEFGLNITVNVFRTITITVNPAFTHTIDAVKTVSGVSTINSTSTVTILEQKIKNAQASISSQFGLTIEFITWKSKWYGSPRPLTWNKSNVGNLAATLRSQDIVLAKTSQETAVNSGVNDWFTIGEQDFTAEILMSIQNPYLIPYSADQDFVPFIWFIKPNVAGLNYNLPALNQSSDFSRANLLAYFTKQTPSRLIVALNDPTYGFQPIGIITLPNTGGFYNFYMAFGRQNGVFKFQHDNTLTSTTLPNYITTNIPATRTISLINSTRIADSSIVNFQIDYFHFKIGEWLPSGPDASDNSVPPTVYSNEYTKTYARFAGNLNDTLTALMTGSATISATATVTAQAGKSVSASATLNPQFAVSVIIGEVFEVAATLNAEFNHSANGTRIKQFDSVITVEFTHTTVAERTLPGAASITAQHTLELTITRIFVLQSSFESIATQLTSVARVGAGLILAEVFVNQSVTAVKTTVAQADATVISTLVLAADRFRLTTADTQIEFNLNAVNSRIRALNSAQQTDSALTVTTVRIRSTDSTQNSAFTIFCEPLPILRGISNQSVEFTQSIITDRTRSTSVTFNTAFTQQSNVIIAVDAVAALSTQSQITCVVDRIRPGVIIMDAVAVNVTAAAKTGTGLVTVELQSQCTVTAQKTTDIQLNAVSTAELTSIIERIQQGVANITATFNLTANGVLSTDVTANLNTIFSTTATAQKTVRVIANITSAGGFVMAVVAIRNGEIIMVTQTNIVTSADRRRNTGANFTNSFTVNILAGVLAVANSVQNTQFAIIATVSKLRLDDIVLYIKTESRTHHINNEQRSYALRQENRLYTIEE
jgi:hypothetical protein